jgi:activator of HSP90 ATPase
MNWRNKRWPDNHHSIATLEFTEKADCSNLKLTQSDIPANFVENTEEGWRNFYWNAIRQTFGYGSRLV